MSWFRSPSPQEQREAAVLRQWRRERLVDRLEDLPLEFLLRHQLNRLQRIQEDALEQTGCLPVHRKLKRLIWKKIGSANKLLISRPAKWLIRRRCLQPLRRAVVQSLRLLACRILTAMVRKLRLSLGNQTRSSVSLMSSSKPPKNPASDTSSAAAPKPD